MNYRTVKETALRWRVSASLCLQAPHLNWGKTRIAESICFRLYALQSHTVF